MAHLGAIMAHLSAIMAHLGAIMAHLVAIDGTWRQLDLNFAHLAAIFAPTCAEIPRKSRAPRQKVPQDLPALLQEQIFQVTAPSQASQNTKKPWFSIHSLLYTLLMYLDP